MLRAVYVAGSLPGVLNPTVGDIYLISNFSQFNANNQIHKVTFDSLGNIYAANNENSTVYKIDTAGVVSAVFGKPGGTVGSCTGTDKYNDGCGAYNATLSSLQAVAIDASNNLNIVDEGDNLIRGVTQNASALAFGDKFYSLPGEPQTVIVSNLGSGSLDLSNLAVTTPFSEGSGTLSLYPACTSATTLATNASCQYAVIFNPGGVTSSTETGTLVVASNSTNAASGENTVALSGTATQGKISVTFTASPLLAGPGQPIVFTSTVVPDVATPTVPTGTVTFTNGTNNYGTATLNASGVATYTTNQLAAGTYTSPLARKEPGHKVDRADCHAHAEDDPGDGFLGLAFAIGEHQPADDDGDQQQPSGNRAGEGGFEDVDGVIPRIAAGALRIHGQRRAKHKQAGKDTRTGQTPKGATPKRWRKFPIHIPHSPIRNIRIDC